MKWDKRFLRLAKEVSTWSKDPSTKVGAVIVDKNKRVLSVGFNGFPKGVKDTGGLYGNREEKYKRILHAEQNALSFTGRTDLTDCTLYVYPLPPCHRCALEIIQRGITEVVTTRPKGEDRWEKSFELAEQLFNEGKVDVTFYGKEWIDDSTND